MSRATAFLTHCRARCHTSCGIQRSEPARVGVTSLTHRSKQLACSGAMWTLGGRDPPPQTHLTHGSQRRHALVQMHGDTLANAWGCVAGRGGETCSVTTRLNPSPAAHARHSHTVTVTPYDPKTRSGSESESRPNDMCACDPEPSTRAKRRPDMAARLDSR